jgi:hypothetical protein
VNNSVTPKRSQYSLFCPCPDNGQGFFVPAPAGPRPVGVGTLLSPATAETISCLLSHISPQHIPPQPPAKQNFTYQLESNDLPFDKDVEKREYWLQVYNCDVIVKKPSRSMKIDASGKRGHIFQFSKESAKRLNFVARNSGHHVLSQFCCTYHETWPDHGWQIKRTLEKFIKRLKRRFQTEQFYFLWCLEFQERGAPHIHFFSSIPISPENQSFIAQQWLEVSGQESDEKAVWWHCRPANFFTWEMKSGDYLVKEYISKFDQKQIPEKFHSVGRFWGHSRNMKPDFNTVAPADHDEAMRDIYRRTVRILTKCHERKIDHYKTFGAIFDDKISLFYPMKKEEIPAKTKKELSIGIRMSKHHLTHRRRPKTNLNRKQQSYKLPGMAPRFYDVASFFMAPAVQGGFLSFSRYADNPDTTPPAKQNSTPF